jgi:hypothetical protein
MPVIVTKTRRIVSEKVLSNGLCSMGIEFSILGIVSEGESGLEFKLPKTPLEKKQVEVKCAGETCRINLVFGHFRVPPHPGKKAVEDWLDGLEKIQKSVEEANRIRTLKSQISSLN